MSSPLKAYYQNLQNKDILPDPQQQKAMEHFERVYTDLNQTLRTTLAVRLHLKKIPPVRGIYLWGNVGGGKTLLMDIFYHALTEQKKLRLHFYRFMQEIHTKLQQLQGHSDPLKIVAREWATRAKIICLDEFLVGDIVDAMLLARLLTVLFAEGITLITTANVEPDQLYRNGLQRDRFLPAIALIKQYLEIVYLSNPMDYRQQYHKSIEGYYYPLNAATSAHLQQAFLSLTQATLLEKKLLSLQGRTVPAEAVANQAVWFDFHTLCHVPRSQLDYIEIAQNFRVVFLSNVPQISADQDDTIRYFINLIDVFYDAQIKLILSAAVPVNELYPAGRFIFEFQRTQSRLIEMQSMEYLQKTLELQVKSESPFSRG